MPTVLYGRYHTDSTEFNELEAEEEFTLPSDEEEADANLVITAENSESLALDEAYFSNSAFQTEFNTGYYLQVRQVQLIRQNLIAFVSTQAAIEASL